MNPEQEKLIHQRLNQLEARQVAHSALTVAALAKLEALRHCLQAQCHKPDMTLKEFYNLWALAEERAAVEQQKHYQQTFAHAALAAQAAGDPPPHTAQGLN